MLEKILEQHKAPNVQPWPAKSAGMVKRIDAELIGRASVQLGAGRQKADDPIDFAVGFSKIKKVGEKVATEEPLFMIHARNERSIVNIRPLLEKAVEVG
jgi:pyrimidine-nucleoside phosphorylase